MIPPLKMIENSTTLAILGNPSGGLRIVGKFSFRPFAHAVSPQFWKNDKIRPDLKKMTDMIERLIGFVSSFYNIP